MAGTSNRLTAALLASLLVVPAGTLAFAQPRVVGAGPTGEAVGVRRPAAQQPGPAARQGAATPAAPASEPVAAAPPAQSPSPVEDSFASRALLRLDQVEAELRSMTDRVERLEAETRRLKEENASLREQAVTGSSSPVASLAGSAEASAATTSPTETPAAETPLAVADSNTATVTPSAEPSTSAAPAPASVARVAALPDGASPVTVLREARMSLQTRDYQQAETKLSALVETWPDAPEAIEGRWLLGETRFVQQAWAPAAEAYVAYLSVSPEGRRVPEIYIRLAGVFRNVGDEAQRCRALGAFKDAFPDPGPVMLARYTQEAAAAPACRA
jgi:TolA-binding protein